MARKPMTVNKRSLMAVNEMLERGIDPINMLMDVYTRAIAAYDECRGLGDKSDAGPGYLSTALGAASKLASFRYPTLSAIAVKDMNQDKDESKPINTYEAIQIIKNDPFLPKELKTMPKEGAPQPLNGILPVGKENKVNDNDSQ